MSAPHLWKLFWLIRPRGRVGRKLRRYLQLDFDALRVDTLHEVNAFVVRCQGRADQENVCSFQLGYRGVLIGYAGAQRIDEVYADYQSCRRPRIDGLRQTEESKR